MLKLLLKILIFGIPAVAAQAANHTVTAYDDYFDPQNLTINAGDTVTFHNGSNDKSEQHNAHAISGPTLFDCANDCGANNAPSSAAWTDTVTFPTAGTIHYQCDVHASMGMTGTIVVNSSTTTTPIALGGYLSGNWYDASQGGHGFELEFTGQPSATTGQNTVDVYWYAYTPDGSAQNWIFAYGPYDATSNTVTLPAYLFTGAKFPTSSQFDAGDIKQADWGTLTFTFNDCNNGTASWTAALPGYGSGSIPITRLTNVAGTTCPAQ